MPRKEQALDETGAIVIVKYDNRRLYDKGVASYITYKEVINMVKGGSKVRVTERKTGKDITCETLLACLATLHAERPIFTTEELHYMLRERAPAKKAA